MKPHVQRWCWSLATAAGIVGLAFVTPDTRAAVISNDRWPGLAFGLFAMFSACCTALSGWSVYRTRRAASNSEPDERAQDNGI